MSNEPGQVDRDCDPSASAVTKAIAVVRFAAICGDAGFGLPFPVKTMNDDDEVRRDKSLYRQRNSLSDVSIA